MEGKRMVFNQPILQSIVNRFKKSVDNELKRQDALIDYEIDEYDERFLRHLALGFTKEQITNLRGMPFGVKSLEKTSWCKSFSPKATDVLASMLRDWW